MLNDWFRELKFEADWEAFQKLPRHPAYRYQFLDGHCLINARPVFYHARLDLKSFLDQHRDVTHSTSIKVVPLQEVPIQQLFSLFASAFARTVPFQHLNEAQQHASAETLVSRTLAEEDGPLVLEAAFGVVERDTGQLCGVILPTLVPSDDFKNFSSESWLREPPGNPVQNVWGQPHLTWVFVDPRFSRRGIGQSLLQCCSQTLHDLGYQSLYSTFLLGNSASMLWHWRMGFTLLSYVSS